MDSFQHTTDFFTSTAEWECVPHFRAGKSEIATVAECSLNNIMGISGRNEIPGLSRSFEKRRCVDGE